MPWDAAAASFILQKAGAKITDGNGKKYSLFTPSILAAHPVVHSKILDLLSHQKAA
jgi:fructose-1,6-bisphosphatase/inositol monophosphatase family enzyme